MATASDRAKILAKAFNSAREANILDETDSDDIGALITDYFATPSSSASDDAAVEHVGSDDEGTEDDCSIQEDHSRNIDSNTDDNANSESESDDDDLVVTVIPDIAIDVHDNVGVSADTERQPETRSSWQATKRSPMPLTAAVYALFSLDSAKLRTLAPIIIQWTTNDKQACPRV